MHTLLIFSSVYQLSLLANVNAYVLFAANLDDFKYLAKKIIPHDLADQLASMVSKYPIKSRDNDRLDVKSAAEQSYRDTRKKKKFQILNQDIDAIVEKLKEKLGKDFRKNDSNTDLARKAKYLELSMDANERPDVNTNEDKQHDHDTMQNKNDEIQNKKYKTRNKKNERHNINYGRQTKNDEHRLSKGEEDDKRQLKTEDYQISQFERDSLRLKREKIETEQSMYENSDEHKSNNEKYEALQSHEDENNNQQSGQEEKYLKQIKIYVNKSSEENHHQNAQIRHAFKKQQPKRDVDQNERQDHQYYEKNQPKSNHNKQAKHGYNVKEHTVHDAYENAQSKHGNRNKKTKNDFYEKEQLKRDASQIEHQETEDYEKERPKHESIQKERPKNKNLGHSAASENKQSKTYVNKKKKKAKHFPNYDEFSDNIKDYTDTKQANADTFGDGESLTKHDSYEDYVTPKKDDPNDTADEKSAESTPKVRTTKKTNSEDDYEEVNEESAKLTTGNVKEEQNGGLRDVKARTENLFYEDLATDNTKRPVKNTMIPTKKYYRFSSPNYYAKLVTPAEKYDFDEPLPEKDREKENLKSLPNFPASINGKRGLKV